jgi:hypothetical protein
MNLDRLLDEFITTKTSVQNGGQKLSMISRRSQPVDDDGLFSRQ